MMTWRWLVSVALYLIAYAGLIFAIVYADCAAGKEGNYEGHSPRAIIPNASGVDTLAGIPSSPLRLPPAVVSPADPLEACEKRTYSERGRTICLISVVFRDRTGAAYRIAGCETGGTFDARAIGAAGEVGIFQIYPLFHADKWPWFWERWDDPYWNAQMAYEISKGGTDWSQWTTKDCANAQ